MNTPRKLLTFPSKSDSRGKVNLMCSLHATWVITLLVEMPRTAVFNSLNRGTSYCSIFSSTEHMTPKSEGQNARST
jgi:hypothetical protein